MTDDHGAYIYIAKACAGNDPTTVVGVPFGFDIICAAILLGGFVDRMINSAPSMIVMGTATKGNRANLRRLEFPLINLFTPNKTARYFG